MHHRPRAIGLVSLGLMLAGTSACTSFAGGQTAAGSQASAAAALSSAATAKPGTYGQPANPSLPNPTDVARDAPVSVAPSQPAGTIFVTYSRWNAQSNWVEVSGYLADVVENDGTCTLTLKNGAATATGTNPGKPNVTSTSCGRVTVARDKLSSGTWTATLTYRSPRSSGQSAPAEVTVP